MDANTPSMEKKLLFDTGKGCSVCGHTPVVNVEGTYWLCGDCVNERLAEGNKWEGREHEQFCKTQEALQRATSAEATVSQLRDELASVIERCAKVCDGVQAVSYLTVAKHCAKAIRALNSPAKEER